MGVTQNHGFHSSFIFNAAYAIGDSGEYNVNLHVNLVLNQTIPKMID